VKSFLAQLRELGANRFAAIAGVGAVALLIAAWVAFGGAASRHAQVSDSRLARADELAGAIRAFDGVGSARVRLPDAGGTGAALVTLGLGPGGAPSEEVRAIQTIVAAAAPGMKPAGVIVVDQHGRLLSSDAEAAAENSKAAVETALRERVKDLVEAVVGAGDARVQVNADVDERQVTTQAETFDPDSQVVRSVATSRSGAPDVSTTSYDISKTITTAVQPPGAIRRISVAVAVDGVRTPGREGRPASWAPRTADEMQRIDSLVKAAIGYSEKRGDVVQVVNLPLSPPDAPPSAGWLPGAAGPARWLEVAVFAVVAALTLALATRPLLRARLASAAAGAAQEAQPANDAPALRRAAQFADDHPEASARVLRGWLKETA